MTVNKRKKNSRFRGSHTHGWGAKKKHRGAGHRGGRGMAGSGKRADQKKPSILKEFGNDYYGKHGFNRPQKLVLKIKAINIAQLILKIPYFLEKKLIAKTDGFYVIDAEKIGYNKILGGGKVDVKIKIKSPYITKLAKEKIERSGGSIVTENVSNN